MNEYRFNEDETEVTAFGKTYVAVDDDSAGCDGCAFHWYSVNQDTCACHCVAKKRPDGRDIIWKLRGRTMTNEEKARELGLKYQTPCHGVGDCEFEATQAAMEMAQWKDEQYFQDPFKSDMTVFDRMKQRLIDKACEWLSHRIFNCGEGNLINDFKKAMEEEQ